MTDDLQPATLSDRVKAALAALSQTHGSDRLSALEVVVRELAWELIGRLREEPTPKKAQEEANG